jgi:hypothetical protein
MTVAERPEDLRRLDRFRALYPAVVIDRVDGFDFWQAWIPEENGGTVITRYLLRDLLRELDQRHPPRHTANDANPDRPHTQRTVRAAPDLEQDDMTNLPAPDAAARITDFLADHLCWSAFWDKRECVWRVSEDDPDSDLYAASRDADTVIAYMAGHSKNQSPRPPASSLPHPA